jgi:hypothetical protein
MAEGEGCMTIIKTPAASRDQAVNVKFQPSTLIPETDVQHAIQRVGSLATAGGGGGVRISAGTQLASSGTVVFSNSNNVTFGMTNSSIVTASASFNQSNQTLGFFASSNTTGQSSSTSFDARSISFFGAGIASIGYSNGSIVVSVPSGGGAGDGVNIIAAGTQTAATTGTVLFSNSNNVSFGMSNSSRVTASFAVNVSAGTTSTNISALTFSNSNGVSFGINGGVVTASAAAAANINLSAGTTSNNLSAFVLSNSNNVSFGLQGSTVTATATFAQSNQAFSAAGGSSAFQTLIFANSFGVSFSNSNGSVVGSIASSLTAINVSAGTTSNNLSALTFSNGSNVSFGLNGSVLTASVASSLTAINVSAGTTSNNLSAVTFSNANGISFGLNGSVVTASHATSLTAVNISAGTTSNNLSALVFSNAGNVSFGLNGSTVTATATVASSLTNINVSAGTTSNNLSALVFSNANGVSFGLNGSTLTASAAGGGGGAGVGWFNLLAPNTSGNTSASGSTIGLSGLNLTLSGTNVSNIVISAPPVSSLVATGGLSISTAGSTISVGFPAFTQTLSSYAPIQAFGASSTLQVMSTTTAANVSIFPFQLDNYLSAGIMHFPVSMGYQSATGSGRQTAGLAFGIYSRNGASLSQIMSQSFSIGVTENSVSLTINQPTTTNYAGFTTNTVSSAAIALSSAYTGGKAIGIPISTLLSPGQYFAAFLYTVSSSSSNVGLQLSYMGAVLPNMLNSLAPIGSFSSAYSAIFDVNGGRISLGHGIAPATTALPASININSISSGSLVSAYPLMNFWST